MVDSFIRKNTRLLVIFFATLIMMMVSGYSFYKNKLEERQLITVAGGEPGSISYKIMEAVASIVNADEEYDFRMKVIMTQGSIENTRLLSEDLVNMATMQANLKVNNKTRLVANLYEEVVHFMFQPSISINSIEDINGIKVAVPTHNSGENFAFEELKDHFNLNEERILPVLSTWKSATWLFENGDVDAIFKVREANHEDIKQFIIETGAHSEEITQAKAIALSYPMFHSAYIPRGAYHGMPPNPSEPIATLGVDRLLVATKDTPAEIVNAIATVLFTRKRELTDLTKAGGLSQVPQETSLIPWHQGLVDFVNKEKPNFFQKNAEILALLLSVIILLGSSFVQFFNRAKQQKLNGYNEQLLSIKINVEQTHDLEDLLKLREEHYALVNQIVRDAVQGEISSEGFEFFTFGWDSVTSLINDKERTLQDG